MKKKKTIKKKKPAGSMEQLMGRKMDMHKEIEADGINPSIMAVVKKLMAKVGRS